MKKETIKSALLAFLVVSSVILTVNNWFSEKLWPYGYNFFSNLANYFSVDNNRSYYLSKENVSSPAKIVVNNIEKRSVYTHTSADFDKMTSHIKAMLKTGLKEKTTTESTAEAWKDALRHKSIYFSYPVPYDLRTFSAILDSPINALTDGSVQEFVLISPDNVTGSAHLLIKNADAEKYTDITLSDKSDKTEMLTEKYAVSSVGEYPYSFEINFDTSEKKQKLTIDSKVILPITPAQVSSVKEINYFENISSDRDLYTEFLRAFGFNPSNIRKNVNADNSIVFAENYGTIKMYPDGLLEFKALNEAKGIEIGNSLEFYDTFIDCIEFVNNVWDTACSDENMNINLSSATPGSTGNSFSLTIDYYADGLEVVSLLESTEAHPALNHAVEIEVVNSRIVSYRQLVKGYRSNGDIRQCTGVIEALDTLMANESIESDKITDMYIAYYPDGSGNCSPSWVAKTAKNEIRIIIDK